MTDEQLDEIERQIGIGRTLPRADRWALDTLALLLGEVRRLRVFAHEVAVFTHPPVGPAYLHQRAQETLGSPDGTPAHPH